MNKLQESARIEIRKYERFGEIKTNAKIEKCEKPAEIKGDLQ